jgi:pantoate--beta-alanine ligase
MPTTATRLLQVSTIAEVRREVRRLRDSGATIGFVPTMGALHSGHTSLVTVARSMCDAVVMSIFVNPLQFGPSEDFSRYPRPVEDDDRIAEECGVDVLFRPIVEEMYPVGSVIRVSGGDLATRWEGESRPGHFDGVLTVVAKLFNIVQPNIAVFGQKDLQQAFLVKAMARDLDFPMAIEIAPTVREGDGLALSSRNRYLNASERKQATKLSEALRAIKKEFVKGERKLNPLEKAGQSVLAAAEGVRTDYLAVINTATFQREDPVEDGFAAIIAARVGATRLIDNVLLGSDDQD